MLNPYNNPPEKRNRCKNIEMKPSKLAPRKITMAIAIALTSLCANAQEIPKEAPKVSAGLYITVTENEVYIIKDGKQFDVRTGETAWVGEDSVELLRTSAKFLNWPCGESGTQASVLKPSYSMDSLLPQNRIEQMCQFRQGNRQTARVGMTCMLRVSATSAEEHGWQQPGKRLNLLFLILIGARHACF